MPMKPLSFFTFPAALSTSWFAHDTSRMCVWAAAFDSLARI